MKLNLNNVMNLITNDLKKWDKLHFESTITNEKVEAKAEITINSLNCNVMAVITVYSGGGTLFRAIFDKIEKTPKTLNLVNAYNSNGSFFKAFIRDDDYLELEHYFVCYEEHMLDEYASEFLVRLSDVTKEEEIRRLVSYTYE